MGLYDLLFGCAHEHYTFPLTVRAKSRRSEAAALTGTYVVCLDCGKEFPYDWQAMKVMHSKPTASGAREPITILASHKVA
jgi:hypothetical protein